MRPPHLKQRAPAASSSSSPYPPIRLSAVLIHGDRRLDRHGHAKTEAEREAGGGARASNLPALWNQRIDDGNMVGVFVKWAPAASKWAQESDEHSSEYVQQILREWALGVPPGH